MVKKKEMVGSLHPMATEEQGDISKPLDCMWKRRHVLKTKNIVISQVFKTSR